MTHATRLLGLVLLVCAACPTPPPPATDTAGGTGGSEDGSEDGGPTGNESGNESGNEPGAPTIVLSVNKDVDVLFVIDNSGSMGEAQGLLAASFPAFIDVLEAESVAANYRIGFTTTDNGNPSCGYSTPEAGGLVFSSCRSRTGEFVFNGNPPADATAAACTDVCSVDTIVSVPTTTEFDDEPKPRPWLEKTDGRTNLEGDLDATEALRCVAPQGIAGCGFESHLESMYKALLRARNEDEDEHGFLRSNAVLAVIIVSDEVDCSYNNDYASIFLPAADGGDPAIFWSDPDAAAPTSAVCWNAGVVCDGSGTPYDFCRAANKDVNGSIDVPDDDAVMQPLSRYVDYLQDIETSKQEINPNQEVLVSLITGVPQDYDGEPIYARARDPAEQGEFGIGAGCTRDDGDPATPLATARPPVREKEVAEAFEVGGAPSLHSICQQSYTDALAAIANSIADQIRPTCMTACVADTEPATAGVQPACTLVQQAYHDASGDVSETGIEPCAADGTLPGNADVCFVALVGDAMSEECAAEGWNLQFRLVRREGVRASGAYVVATCELSQNDASDCPLLP